MAALETIKINILQGHSEVTPAGIVVLAQVYWRRHGSPEGDFHFIKTYGQTEGTVVNYGHIVGIDFPNLGFGVKRVEVRQRNGHIKRIWKWTARPSEETLVLLYLAFR